MEQFMQKFIPFALPDIGDEEINSVVECLKSGWLTTGPYAKKFEENFAAYIDPKATAVAINSASMGLLLALEAFGVKPGDEVIVPTYTFSATAMMPVHLGAKPVLVDVEEGSLNIDPAKIEAAITEKTKVIIPVHFAGLPCDMDAINAIAKKHGIKVLEDAAHALPTTYNGKLIGNNSSDATVYSFYATKTITSGEGGMILTRDQELISRARMMRLHGISRDVFDRYVSPGSKWYYEIVAPGSKCNLTDLAAAIGIEQLKKCDTFHKRRKKIAQFYLDEFKNLPIKLPELPKEGDGHAWHLFVIRLMDNVINRDAFITKMSEANIGCSVHFIPLHLHPYYQKTLGYKSGDFPIAEKAFNNAVSLPIYTKMTDAEVERVANAVKVTLG
jgi:dTDP-4-amino-4,6-dideoxygalactose transaminase